MSISSRLKAKRLELGFTQQQLASKCGIKQQTIQRIEGGTSNRPRHLVEIAEALNCSPQWLLKGRDDQANIHPAVSIDAQEAQQ